MDQEVRRSRPKVCIGSGWLGKSLASTFQMELVSRRCFDPGWLSNDATVFVASGRSAFTHKRDVQALREELRHLRDVLDACESINARRVVVLGSSDVAGLSERITGRSPQAPLTFYAEVKCALEDECLQRAADGMPITNVRLAPVHGSGKDRTQVMVRRARLHAVPLPRGGYHSIGFVLLRDALRALEYVGTHPTPPVVSVGGGTTPLRELLQQLAFSAGSRPRWLSIPVPVSSLGRLAQLPVPESIHRLTRLALPRSVEMEVPVPITPIAQAAAELVATC